VLYEMLTTYGMWAISEPLAMLAGGYVKGEGGKMEATADAMVLVLGPWLEIDKVHTDGSAIESRLRSNPTACLKVLLAALEQTDTNIEETFCFKPEDKQSQKEMRRKVELWNHWAHDHIAMASLWRSGRNRCGVQGVHLNPLGRFLRASTPCVF
jgi:hypothetical protein